MKIWTATYMIHPNINIVPNTNTTERPIKFLTFINNNLFLEYKTIHNKTIHNKIAIENIFERYVYFEILNESPLWNIEIIFMLSSRNKYTIDINIEPSLINDFMNQSIALNTLLTNEYMKIPNFIKFNDSKSYLSNVITNEPTDLKVKLYDHQKKSLAKMIHMEQNIIDFKIEYTTTLNFHDLISVKFDPIKNIKTNKKRVFKIKSRGGILADEMGLGKTITTIALITANPAPSNLKLKYSETDNYWKLFSKATLIVCPSHIAKQWKSEIKKINPKLKVLTILTKIEHEKVYFKDFIDADIIITSHQFLMNFKYYPCIHYTNTTASMFNAEHRNGALKKYYTDNITSSDNNIDNDVYEAIKHLELPLFEFFYFHRLVLDEGHEIFGEMLLNVAQSRYMSLWLSSVDSNKYWYISGSPFINYTGLINCVKYLNLVLVDTAMNIEINRDTFSSSELFNNILKKEYLWDSILEHICIRHRKCDISSDISLFGYDENIEWIEFTDLERNLYNSKKYKLNNEGLQQLCCHPLILDSCRKVLGHTNVDLTVMQTTLIEHHTKLVENYTVKLSLLQSHNHAYYMLKKSYETILTESKYMLTILNKLDTNQPDNIDDECAICLSNVSNGSITKCGHIFCTDCINQSLKYKQVCPLCKKDIKGNDIYIINKKNKPNKPNGNNALIEKYGSKLGKIISMIIKLITEPTTRIIIFSQWDFMLLLIGRTLAENGIANCFVKGNVWSRTSAIDKFKNGKTLSGEDNKVIMLSLKNSASGTNLTEATHIFFVEPINSSKEQINVIEGQAIGRACRIGQKQKVQLYRILIKDTIEEEIYNKNYK